MRKRDKGRSPVAKQISNFDFQDGSRPEYPWSDWEQGTWQIFQGDDFDVTLKSMQSQIYLRAHDQGRPVKTRLQSDPPSIIFQFGDPTPELLEKAEARRQRRSTNTAAVGDGNSS